MEQLSIGDIEALVRAFNQRRLPKTEWTHQAHIIVAFWYNWHFPFFDAVNLVRENIIAYNESVGTPNTDSSGYHETLTIFWMRFTKNFLANHPQPTVEAACNAFLNSGQAIAVLPMEYYSKERLFSVQARREWVPGDLQELELIE